MPNQYVNKVVQSNGTTLIDITPTTAVASDVASGKIFFLADGTQATGTGGGGGSVTWETMADQTCTITTYDGMRIITINGYNEPLSANETYRITWGDTQYICNTIADPVGFTQDGYFIGNSGVFGSQYEDTGEPFALYRTSSTKMIGATNDTASSVYVKIEKQVTSSATLVTKTITANGTYSASDDSADGYSSVTVNVPSGGSSNIVTGTFTGTTTGTVLDVNVNYSGIGYPIAIFVVPTGGMFGNTTYNSLVQRYAIGYFSAYKTYVSQTPTYQNKGTENQYSICSGYKNSTSAANNYTRAFGPNTIITYGTSADPGGALQSLLFRTNKKFSVRIASTSYGFAANIEYTYHIIYSS